VVRILEPESSDAKGMIIFALIGITVNGYAAWKLSSGKTLNEKVVSWHLLEDVLGWFAVLIVAIILLFKDIQYLDPALSLLITLYILYNVFKRLKETLFIFLQGVPKDIDLKALENSILKVENIDSLHHMHVWSMEGEHHVFTVHIKLKHIQELKELQEVKECMREILKEYHFDHFTVETELDSDTCKLE